jgi:hypothetical protein
MYLIYSKLIVDFQQNKNITDDTRNFIVNEIKRILEILSISIYNNFYYTETRDPNFSNYINSYLDNYN